ADLAPDLIDLLEIVGQFLALDDDPALLMLLQTIDATDHRRFARTGRAADHNPLAAHHPQVDVLQYVEIAIPFVHVDDIDRHLRVGDMHLAGIDPDFVGSDRVFYDHG